MKKITPVMSFWKVNKWFIRQTPKHQCQLSTNALLVNSFHALRPVNNALLRHYSSALWIIPMDLKTGWKKKNHFFYLSNLKLRHFSNFFKALSFHLMLLKMKKKEKLDRNVLTASAPVWCKNHFEKNFTDHKFFILLFSALLFKNLLIHSLKLQFG